MARIAVQFHPMISLATNKGGNWVDIVLSQRSVGPFDELGTGKSTR
jgi:hypothetical protein